jgi:HK97 family phage major capsid protein
MSLEQLTQKIDEMGRAFDAFKNANESELKALKNTGTISQEIKDRTDKANNEITKLQAEIKALETAIARGSHGGGEKSEKTDEATAEYKGKLLGFLRGNVNEQEIKQAEKKYLQAKAMSVDSDANGGFLVTPEMSAEIIKKEYESSPMRAISSVTTISSGSLKFLEDLDEADAEWVSEQGTRNETNTPQLKMIEIPVHEMSAKPKVTQTLLDDAMFNLESWLSGKVAEKFGRKEATAFVAGDGAGKPKGILSYANGTGFNQIQQVKSGHATLLTGDGLIDLQASLKASYQANAMFLMKRLTEAEIRKLKDSEGRYIWQPGLSQGAPSLLLGKPIMWADDMQAVGASGLAVAYGDFRQGYQIVDRIGIRIVRDIFTAHPHVKFNTSKRVGGGVKNFEAIKLQVVSA